MNCTHENPCSDRAPSECDNHGCPAHAVHRSSPSACCATCTHWESGGTRSYGSCRVILTKIDAYNDDGAAYGCDTDHDFGCVLHSPCSASAA